MVMATVSGQKTLGSIEQALEEVSKKADRLSAELEKANQAKAKLIPQRLEAFQDLAKFRTELALVDGVIDEADQLSGRVRAILTARQTTLDALKQREAGAGEARARLLEQQKAATGEIEDLERRLDEFGKKARKALASDAAYSAHAKHHEELAGMVTKASEKAEKSSKEAAEKGAPYRNDPLFIYLWDRKYATADYDRTGVIRALDSWVAKLVKYPDARSNFAVLTQIPERLAAHVERLRAVLQTERDAIDAIEAAKIKELAGDDLLKKLHDAHSQKDAQTTELERLNAELVETGKQLKLYAEGLDQSFQEAVTRTTQFLEGQSLTALRYEARNTPDISDDEIVGVIARLADELRDLEHLVKTKREALDQAFERKEELLGIAAKFRRSQYDRPGSVFETSGDGQRLLEMLLNGAITAVEYWARTQSRQSWRGRPADSYRRSESVPMRRGSRSGPSSSGKDFTTGGGF